MSQGSAPPKRKDVVVVFVHGINVTREDYYVAMRDRLLSALPRADRPHAVFRAVFWADIVRGRQQEYLLYARTMPKFRDTMLHRMVVQGLGDAAAYQKTEWHENSAYYEIQSRLRKTITDVTTGEKDVRPLMFISHSLGCHIVSTYAWDLHKLRPSAEYNPREHLHGNAHRFWANHLPHTPFERLETFAGFVTMGNNMPLFAFTIGPQFVHPITRSQGPQLSPAFPGPGIAPSVMDQARWLNFYSANDPLGYPLKPLNDAYDNEPRLSDIHARSEGWFKSVFLPGSLRQFAGIAAHGGYWTNGTVIKGTAKLLHDIINADDLAQAAARRRERSRKTTTASAS